MAVCDRCGKANDPQATNCRRCGTRLRPDRLSEASHVAGFGSPAGGRSPAVRGRLVSVREDGTDSAVNWLESDQVDIGREEGDVRFDDPQLAPRHARLNLTLGGAMLTPLDRRNGVYVRLRGLTELADGDHLLLGRQVLRFETVPEHERRPRAAREDGVVLFGTPSRPAWGRLRQMMASGLGRDVYHLSGAESRARPRARGSRCSPTTNSCRGATPACGWRPPACCSRTSAARTAPMYV